MNNANILKPALIGGVALGVLSALPVIGYCNCICCAWAIGGGILAAYLYVRESPFQVTMGRGALAGLAAGAIGSVVCSLFSIPLLFMKVGVGNSAMLMERFEDLMAKNPDFPLEARQVIEDILQRSDFVIIFAIMSFLGNIVFFSLFAMLGGAIGVAIFEKRKQDGTPSNVNHPPPPPVMPPPSLPY